MVVLLCCEIELCALGQYKVICNMLYFDKQSMLCKTYEIYLVGLGPHMCYIMFIHVLKDYK